mgnify:CR=1 FL=1
MDVIPSRYPFATRNHFVVSVKAENKKMIFSAYGSENRSDTKRNMTIITSKRKARRFIRGAPLFFYVKVFIPLIISL